MAEQALLLHAGKINDIIRCSRVAPEYGDKDKLQRRWYLSSFCAEVAGRVSCCVSFTLQAFCELHACEQRCVLIKYVRVVIQGISIPTLHGSRPMCSDLCGGAHTAAAQACMMHTLQPQDSRSLYCAGCVKFLLAMGIGAIQGACTCAAQLKDVQPTLMMKQHCYLTMQT